MKALLRERGIRVGRLDSRYIGKNTDNISYQFEADPSAYAIDGAYTQRLMIIFAHNSTLIATRGIIS